MVKILIPGKKSCLLSPSKEVIKSLTYMFGFISLTSKSIMKLRNYSHKILLKLVSSLESIVEKISTCVGWECMSLNVPLVALLLNYFIYKEAMALFRLVIKIDVENLQLWDECWAPLL